MRVAIIAEAHSREAVQILVGATQALDMLFWQRWLAVHGTLPNSLEEFGLWYETEQRSYPDDPDEDRETSSEERFCTVGEMKRRADRGYGADCDDIAPAHAALLRVSGRDLRAKAEVIELGRGRYHVIVRRGNGAIDDPCIAMGMPDPMSHDRAV